MEKTAVFAGGCFWGVEAKFSALPGVTATQVGYSGGFTENPCYCQVCQDNTGHAESVMVTYESEKITYKDLLEAFFKFYDPTVCDPDALGLGSQYRSVIFYSGEEEKKIVENYLSLLNESGSNLPQKLQTEIIPVCPFYPAEEYHQQYYQKHGLHGC